jgi:hypothetical protein
MNELIQLFERQVDYISRREGRGLLLAVPRLIQLVASEPRLRAIAKDLETEYETARQEYLTTDTSLAERLLQLWQQHEGWFTAAWDAALDASEHDESMRSLGHPSSIQQLLTSERNPTLSSDGYKHEQSLVEMVLSPMGMWLANVKRQCQSDTDKQEFDKFQSAYDQIKFDHDVAQRIRCAVEQVHAGAAWSRLVRFAQSLIPPKTDDLESYIATIYELKVANTALDIDVRYEHEKGDLASYRATIFEALGTFREEMVLRFGLHLSHRALVMRFKTKCERFMAQTLLERCKDASRPEDILTSAAAEYLFDQGLNPLFNAPIVTLRPDLFDPSLPHALYIEAKQYNDGSPKTKVVRATWQVWDTWNQLDGQHKVLEAFLLVFRRGGSLLTFDECVRLNGRTLYPIVVDIAPSNAKGSCAKSKSIHISGEELLPQHA